MVFCLRVCLSWVYLAVMCFEVNAFNNITQVNGSLSIVGAVPPIVVINDVLTALTILTPTKKSGHGLIAV